MGTIHCTSGIANLSIEWVTREVLIWKKANGVIYLTICHKWATNLTIVGHKLNNFVAESLSKFLTRKTMAYAEIMAGYWTGRHFPVSPSRTQNFTRESMTFFNHEFIINTNQ